MKRVLTVTLLGIAMVLATGCAQPAPPASAPPTKASQVSQPTQAPAAPAATAKPAQQAPTAPPATAKPAQPTAAPKPAAASPSFPQKGKTITLIVPYNAGGGTDLAARTVAPELEAELGIPVQVVNKGGAATQIGLTELFRAPADGYTIGYTVIPTAITTYIDPDRKAVYDRKGFQTIAIHGFDPTAISVRADSPYKTLQELLAATKAVPESVKMGYGGQLNVNHFAGLRLEQATGAKFREVVFSGAAESIPALLGGHVDAISTNAMNVFPHVRTEAMRSLVVFDKDEYKYLPGVKTAKAQGYNIADYGTVYTISAHANTPKEIIDIYAKAIKKIMDKPAFQQKVADLGFFPRYEDPAQAAKTWESMEGDVKELVEYHKKR